MSREDKGTPAWVVERRALRTLNPHPKQHDFGIPRYTDQEREEMRADMAANGLEHPLDITANGIVLGGHERFVAAKGLAWEFVSCRVRYDLDTDQKQNAFVIRDNLVRRHLTQSQRAAMARQLVIVLGGDPGMGACPISKGIATDSKILPNDILKRHQIAEAAEETPEFRGIEDATDAGEVHLSTASNAAMLPAKVRAQVAKSVLEKPSVNKNRALARATKAARQSLREQEKGVPFWGDGESPETTHKKEYQANMKAFAVLERKLVSEANADEDTIEWALSSARVAAAETPGADLDVLTEFFRRWLSRIRPLVKEPV